MWMCFFSALKLTLNILKKVLMCHPYDAKRPCCHTKLMHLADVMHQFRHLMEPDLELMHLANVTHQFRNHLMQIQFT